MSSQQEVMVDEGVSPASNPDPEYQAWCEKVSKTSCVGCGGSLANGFEYAPDFGKNAGRCTGCATF